MFLYMQEPLQIGDYSDLDLQEFKVQCLPKLVVAIRDRAEEELRMAPVWEAERLARYQALQEEHERNLRDYQTAREALARDTREVNEWVRRQNQERRDS